MKKAVLYVIFVLFVPVLLFAAEIKLPENLHALAVVKKGERDGLWEKTLIVSFKERRRTLATYDGLVEAMAAVNHSAHPLLWQKVSKEFMDKKGCGGKVYTEHIHDQVASELKLKKSDITKMATAADMDNLAVVTKEQGPFSVTILATAGAKTNALRTGVDMSSHVEGEAQHGTINIVVLTNARLTDGAMARAIVTVTEAKTAALQDLKVPSSYTKGVQATGTGTDSVIVVSGTTGPKASYAGGHSLLGSLIGKATYEAIIEALGKQNGFLLPGAKPYVTESSIRLQKVTDNALKWLSLVDNSKYCDSWTQAAPYFRGTVGREKWAEMTANVRKPLGKVLDRKLHRSLHTKRWTGLPDGEYLIIEYKTKFENKTEAIETVTSSLENGGTWKVSGYFIK